MNNPFDKSLLIRRDRQFNITVEFDFFMNPWQDTRFSNISGMTIPSNTLKLVSLNVGLPEISHNVFDWHYRYSIQT